MIMDVITVSQAEFVSFFQEYRAVFFDRCISSLHFGDLPWTVLSAQVLRMGPKRCGVGGFTLPLWLACDFLTVTANSSLYKVLRTFRVFLQPLAERFITTTPHKSDVRLTKTKGSRQAL